MLARYALYQLCHPPALLFSNHLLICVSSAFSIRRTEICLFTAQSRARIIQLLPWLSRSQPPFLFLSSGVMSVPPGYLPGATPFLASSYTHARGSQCHTFHKSQLVICFSPEGKGQFSCLPCGGRCLELWSGSWRAGLDCSCRLLGSVHASAGCHGG